MRKNRFGANFVEKVPVKRDLLDPVRCDNCDTLVERHTTTEIYQDGGQRWICRFVRRCALNVIHNRVGAANGD